MTGSSVHSKPTAMPAMMFVAGPGLRRLGDLAHRAVLVLGVVLRDVDEGDRRQHADDAAEEVHPPGVRAGPALAGSHFVATKKPTIASAAVT